MCVAFLVQQGYSTLKPKHPLKVKYRIDVLRGLVGENKKLCLPATGVKTGDVFNVLCL